MSGDRSPSGFARRAGGPLARAAVAAGCMMLSGCYSHVPADPAVLAPPQRLRVQVSAAEAVRLGQVLGSPRQLVDGELTERTAEGFYLLVPVSVVNEGMGLRTLHQRVFIPQAEMLSLQRRRLDRARTGGMVLIGAGVVGAVLAITLSGRSGGSTGAPPDGGPADARIPRVAVPVR